MGKLKTKPVKSTKVTLRKIETVLESLREGAGIDESCQNASINRVTFWKWKNSSPENEQKYYDVVDSRTLLVEDALYRNAISGNTTAQIFWLKNRAMTRWMDRVEQDLNLKGKIDYVPDFSKFTKEELKEIVQGGAGT